MPHKFIFEQLTDSILDRPYDFLDDYDAAEVVAEGPETTELLQAVYSQTASWLEAVRARWANAPQPQVLADFQRNIQFLTRLLRQSRYPRLALISRRGAGKSSLINALLGQQVAQPGHTRGLPFF